jgi:hypothetical protein
VDDVDQIKKVAVDFYKNLLGTNQLQFTKATVARVNNLFLLLSLLNMQPFWRRRFLLKKSKILCFI